MRECRLCLQKVPSLVKSHIYPRALNHAPGTSGAPLAIVMQTGDVKKSQAGIYEAFLCQRCESIFSEPERHFISFVRDLDAGEPIVDAQGRMIARKYTQRQADPRSLRLYANSLLLRAHLSTHEFFRSTDLGSHYERLKSFVVRNEIGDDDDFSLLLFRYTGLVGRPARSPQRIKIGDANAMILSPPGLRLYIKVDKRPLRGELREAMVKAGQELLVVHQETTRENFAQAFALTEPVRDNISRILARPKRNAGV